MTLNQVQLSDGRYFLIIAFYDYDDYRLVRCDQLSILSAESIQVAARSKAWFYVLSILGISGSNPAADHGRLFLILCVVRQ